MTLQRVVITGYGMVSALGNNSESTFNGIIEEKCGIDVLKKIPIEHLKCKIGAECNLTIEKNEARYQPFQVYALRAAAEAAAMSGFDFSLPSMGAVYIGTGIGGSNLMEKTALDNSENPASTSAFYVPFAIMNMASGLISLNYKLNGSNMAMSTACASGSSAIGELYRMIRNGRIPHGFAGGTESCFSPYVINSFSNMRAMNTKDNDNPKKSVQPFGEGRHGFVMGEGAGILFMESMESAQKRGAKILAEIIGYGSTSDAHHITALDPSGTWIKKSMTNAMKEAKIEAKDINYINAHGTGTNANDETESYCLGEIFGEHRPFVSSIKNAIGHCIGAAGAMELIVSAMALTRNQYPKNFSTEKIEDKMLQSINLTTPVSGRIAMSNSYGFGGHNVSLIIKV